MTLNDDVVSAIEKTLLNSPASCPYFETLIKTFLASAGLHSWKPEDFFPGTNSEASNLFKYKLSFSRR